MRQRKIKDIELKIQDYMDLAVEDPIALRGSWRGLFSDKGSGIDLDADLELGSDADLELGSDAEPYADLEAEFDAGFDSSGLFVEIGCGKGRFIVSSAEANPDAGFIAIEGFSSVIYRAMQKVRASEVKNVRFILDFVFDLGTWFADGELDGIFLNFSDPWPKKKNAKRRLTYRDRLEQYAKALKPGGFLRIKTDNDAFFEFTLEELGAVKDRCGFTVEFMTNDLHNSPWTNQSPMTEYESKFAEAGKNINFLALKKI